MVIYLDGEVFSEPALGFSSAKFSDLLDQLQYVTGLKIGSWDCGWWKYGDFAGSVDDVNIYNTALTQDQVKAAMTTAASDDAAATTTTTVPKTGVVSYELFYGLGAAVLGTGSVLLKRKKASK
jgi:LPXTG-motif cell wall-anchored protein